MDDPAIEGGLTAQHLGRNFLLVMEKSRTRLMMGLRFRQRRVRGFKVQRFRHSWLRSAAEVRTAAEVLSKKFGDRIGLSRRERQVVALTIRGMCTKEIEAELGCSRKTIEQYWYRIYAKVGCQGRDQVMVALVFWVADQIGPANENLSNWLMVDVVESTDTTWESEPCGPRSNS
jgi:DNA-binding CsgD family transcriptional regulator